MYVIITIIITFYKAFLALICADVYYIMIIFV